MAVALLSEELGLGFQLDMFSLCLITYHGQSFHDLALTFRIRKEPINIFLELTED